MCTLYTLGKAHPTTTTLASLSHPTLFDLLTSVRSLPLPHRHNPPPHLQSPPPNPPLHRPQIPPLDLISPHKPPYQQIEHVPKRQRHDRARQDDDIIRHAEIRRREWQQQTRCAEVDIRGRIACVCAVCAGRGRGDETDDGGRDVEAAVGVRWVFGVAEDGFVEVVGQRQG